MSSSLLDNSKSTCKRVVRYLCLGKDFTRAYTFPAPREHEHEGKSQKKPNIAGSFGSLFPWQRQKKRSSCVLVRYHRIILLYCFCFFNFFVKTDDFFLNHHCMVRSQFPWVVCTSAWCVLGCLKEIQNLPTCISSLYSSLQIILLYSLSVS